MSSSMMDTDPGGESTQSAAAPPPLDLNKELTLTPRSQRYESIKTVTKPTPKDGGQMGEPETSVADSSKTSEELQERGEKTADNIRYGQNVSESGMGGKTTTSEGSANAGGFGETAAQEGGEESAEEARNESGYGKGEDMNNEIGG